jgi:scyllo-inositol 2-dehydrogenase (NADP+)
LLEFDTVLFQVESSRICTLERPRWWIIGTLGGFVKHGIDPQEDALRSGDIDAASEPLKHQAVVRGALTQGTLHENRLPSVRGHWDSYYRNVAEAITGRAELAVTAEEAREVVRVLDAAVQSSREHRTIEGPWG